jgi:hypothetical protein
MVSGRATDATKWQNRIAQGFNPGLNPWAMIFCRFAALVDSALSPFLCHRILTALNLAGGLAI